MVIRNLRQEPGDLRPMMALLKALWKLRPPGEPEAPGARLIRRWREKRLLARLERDWPGGMVLHRTGDLVHVPSPLDARGRHALLHPPRIHPAVLGFLQSGAVVIDVGANLGEWTVPFARKVGPAGRVLAIEPAPRSAAALEATLAANALRQTEIIRCAIGGDDGVAQFAVPVVTSARTDTGTARVGPACAGHDALQVPLRSLDSLAAERDLARLDLIKIDVEGHERRVLDGAAAILDRHRPVLVMETGHEAGGDRAAIRDRLAGLGYRMLGILLDYGMASADWPAYTALDPPFCAGDAHNLLLVPDGVIPRVSEGEPVPRRGRGPSRRS
jgi:FkbM family methyltransferase